MRTRTLLFITLVVLMATLTFATESEQKPYPKVDPRCPYGCLNGGECTSDGCDCKTGFVGIDCGNRGCEDNCNDRGYCYIGLTSVRCICHPDWIGTSCDVRRPVTVSGVTSLSTFASAVSKTGKKPATAATTPVTTPNLKSSVKSAPAKPNTLLTGLNKAQDQDPPTEVVCPKPCQNESVCKNKKCYCKDGFGGVDCALVLCPNDCNGRGECDFNTGTCLCSPPYIGKSCETTSKNVK